MQPIWETFKEFSETSWALEKIRNVCKVCTPLRQNQDTIMPKKMLAGKDPWQGRSLPKSTTFHTEVDKIISCQWWVDGGKFISFNDARKAKVFWTELLRKERKLYKIGKHYQFECHATKCEFMNQTTNIFQWLWHIFTLDNSSISSSTKNVFTHAQCHAGLSPGKA